VLLLDEATSALDETSQAKVSAALDEAMKGRTTIVIAHRMSTIEKCDKIFVLDNGKVKEEGTFKALKNKAGGHFSNMAQGKHN
jgi:ABC-type multidrug transport system fused ATPase/permease subunit